jgi:hypothetical protein
VEPLYSTDLKNAYFGALKANPQTQALTGMSENDKKAGPEGPGWVIEVRGYTYHKTPDFVSDSLVDALGTLGHKEPPKDSPPAGKSSGPAKDNKSQAKPAADEVTKPEYWNRAIYNKVSHAVEYKHQTQATAGSGQFLLPSAVSSLVKLPGPFAQLSGTGGNVGVSVATGPAAGAAPGGGDEDDEAFGGRRARRRAAVARAAHPAPVAPAAAQPGQPGAGKPVNAARTDFVVLFVWRENAASPQGETPAAKKKKRGGD